MKQTAKAVLILLLFTLFAFGSSIQLQDLYNYIVSKNPWTIEGWLYRYDFGKDGQYEYDDWLYVSRNGNAYRLLGTIPSRDNAFGLFPLSSIPSDIGAPWGYFIFLNYPKDSVRRFSWLYLSLKSGKIYKLVGVEPSTHYFNYLDLDGDGEPDALSGLSFSKKSEYEVEFSCEPSFNCSVSSNDEIEKGHIKVEIHGTILDDSTGSPLNEVSVTLMDATVSKLVASSASNINGEFNLSTNINKEHSYILIVGKEGYEESRISLDVYLNNLNGKILNYGTIRLIPESNSAIVATIEGLIIDSTSGNAISNAKVKIFKGSNIINSSILPVQETLTDTEGHFKLTGIKGGLNYTLVVEKDGFLTNYRNVTVNEENIYVEISLSPQLIGGQNFRIQLSWGKNPSDLDSHLLFLKNDILEYHIYFHQQYSYYDLKNHDFIETDSNYEESISYLQPEAFLDLDDTTSYGPETITIYKIRSDGVYKYFVHDYSNRDYLESMALANSGAQVKIFTNEGLIKIFNVPYEKGNVWKVFEIRNGNIVPCQESCVFSVRSYKIMEEMKIRSLSNQMIKNVFQYMHEKERK